MAFYYGKLDILVKIWYNILTIEGVVYMKEICLTESAVSRLKQYPLDDVFSSESTIYYLKKDQDRHNVLLKKLFLTDEKRVGRKIDTIRTLQDSELSEYEELVIPDELVTISGVKSGFTLREIEDATNLHLFLNDHRIPKKDKITVLKKIGELLRRVQSQKQEFYFGDLQSYNFLVGKDLDIHAVDLDSSAVSRKKPLETKYVIIDKKSHGVPKYKVNKMGRSYPNRNVDIFCYNTLVLNYLAGRPMHKLSFEEYFDYINYLEECGMPKDMIDIYLNLYTDKNNESVVDDLDSLPDDYGRVDYRVYTALRKRH